MKLFPILEPNACELESAKDKITAQINAYTKIAKSQIPGLMPCGGLETVVATENVPYSKWFVVNKPWYTVILADISQHPEMNLYVGFTRILNALKELHRLNLVHMNVKSENIFVKENLTWDLGEFESVCKRNRSSY